MNIKEIALRLAKSMRDKSGYTTLDLVCNAEAFGEALVAELAKENKPVAFTNSCELEYLDFKRADGGLVTGAMWKEWDKDADIALYSLPPTAEQIEQETAEACIQLLKSKHSHEASAAAHYAGSWQSAYEYYMNRQAVISECIEAIRSGTWKEYK